MTFALVAAAGLLLIGSFLVIRAVIEADNPTLRESAPHAPVHATEHRKAA